MTKLTPKSQILFKYKHSSNNCSCELFNYKVLYMGKKNK